jgi:hypothetical protein
MIVTLVAASLTAAQPASAPAPAMDHGKMEHGKAHGADKAKMDCCKDGCACCAKDKAKPTS